MCQVPPNPGTAEAGLLPGMLQGCTCGAENCAVKISSAGGSWSSWVGSFSLLPCLGRSQMPPPQQGACAMALPGCLLQQVAEEGEIKGFLALRSAW